MRIYEFEIVLDGIAEFSDDDVERLYEAGCDDGLPGASQGVARIAFAREADSFAAAVSSAMRDIGRSEIVARIGRVAPLATEHQADADEFNRALSLLDRLDRSEVHAWPVGQA